MPDLVPYPFGRLVSRVLRELERGDDVLDYPQRKMVRGDPSRDLSVSVHGAPAATPLGPAAGPHTQLAQNILLGYLGGCRIFELKTVQIMDELAIPRPCIDMRTVGFNVEWSQELKLEQSLEEYVKASMLLEIVAASGGLELAPGFERFCFDMSVGYDLAGIRHERVRAFLSGMLDATPIVERLRREIPTEWARYRDLPFRTRISDGITLSTFHGCPPGEIEGISRFLMEEVGVHCVVKLNPTLLGPVEARRIFHEVLGYRYTIPDAAFANDPTFEQAVELVGRLEETSRKTGRGLGVKFSNTLVVDNEGDFLPASEKTSYLSGQPLHVLAMTLVGRFREVFGDRLPVSFSAGIDRHNFADAVSLGLLPVTVCSDLLRAGGYTRLGSYFAELGKRMDAVGAKSVDDFVVRVAGGDMSVAEARLANTRTYVASLLSNARYAAASNAKSPKKVGTTLVLFDCLTCDKCIPVCPNHANFVYTLPEATLPVVKLRRAADGTFTRHEAPPLEIAKKHQIANFADFCNDCGNCDVFCPEDGGPYVLKPRFFGSREGWAAAKTLDGFHVVSDAIHGRFGGRELTLSATPTAGQSRYTGPDFDLVLDDATPEAPLSGHVAPGAEVDLTYFHILRWLRTAVLAAPSYLSEASSREPGSNPQVN